jgi:hypothetical protein
LGGEDGVFDQGEPALTRDRHILKPHLYQCPSTTLVAVGVPALDDSEELEGILIAIVLRAGPWGPTHNFMPISAWVRMRWSRRLLEG